MLKFRTSARLACCVGLIAAAAIWIAHALGALPSPAEREMKHRLMTTKYLCSVAKSLVPTRRDPELRAVMENLIDSDQSLISVGFRSLRGSLVSAGPHEKRRDAETRSSETKHHTQATRNQISAELLANGQPYGKVELVFENLSPMDYGGWLVFPVPLTILVGCFVTLFSWAVFARAFRYLDPSTVVPDRVRSALDTMAEGLVLLDVDGDIGHANGSFERIVDVESGSLLGQPIDGFDWALSGDFGLAVMPWIQCLEEQQQVCGAILDLTTNNQPMRTFIVNATPIVSDGDECRGVLVSFEDVTALEKKKLELSQVIKTLRQSRDEVTRQNERLNYLASFDQLTNCLNRREFFMRFENSWSADENEFLSVIMLDVDHFKSVNDNHGHGAGDEVLRKVSGILIDSIGDRGVVARLGGEEFAALLPKVELQAAELIAEEIRRNIAEAPIEGLKVTITAGVSSREMKPIDWQHLLDQADQALYVGKKRGRNCVESFASLNDPKRVCRQPANAKSEMAAEEVVATQLIDEIGSMLDPLTQRQAEPTTTSQPATKASSPLNSTGR